MEKLKAASLFAGIGGIEKGCEDFFDFLWANEIDLNAAKTYAQNFDHKMLHGDFQHILYPEEALTDRATEIYRKFNAIVTGTEIDLLTGGFPCQPFSIAGEMKGFADKRGNMFFNICRLIETMETKPKALLFENVKNLVTHDNGNTFSVITKTLNNLGYSVKSRVLNTCEYTSLPQNRERIFIVAMLPEYIENFSFDIIWANDNDYAKRDHINNMINNILETDVPDKYYYTKEKYPNVYKYADLDNEVNEHGVIYQFRRQYVRKNMTGVCPTLTANMGSGGHNVPLTFDGKHVRKLTPRECFRLQGMPDSYKLPEMADSHLYKQAGNAVSAPMVRLVAEQIYIALTQQI